MADAVLQENANPILQIGRGRKAVPFSNCSKVQAGAKLCSAEGEEAKIVQKKSRCPSRPNKRIVHRLLLRFSFSQCGGHQWKTTVDHLHRYPHIHFHNNLIEFQTRFLQPLERTAPNRLEFPLSKNAKLSSP